MRVNHLILGFNPKKGVKVMWDGEKWVEINGLYNTQLLSDQNKPSPCVSILDVHQAILIEE